MDDRKIDTPVAFFIYNRPQTTRKVLKRIGLAEPPRLLVIGDGPSNTDSDDQEKVSSARNLIQQNIDWDCEVRTKYAEENMGMRRRFASGLEWVFEQEPEAIILEDDTVPDPTFFRFAEEMLKEYRDDTRVMDIGGTNYLGEWKSQRQDYHFSYFGGFWGWASWRRSWELYDPDMTRWDDPEAKARVRDVIADQDIFNYAHYVYQKTYEGRLDTYDYQWGFARQLNSGLSVVPSTNLVSNVGFGVDATHTDDETSNFAALESESMQFPIDKSDYVAVDRSYDRELHKKRPISMRYGILRTGREFYYGLRERFS